MHRTSKIYKVKSKGGSYKTKKGLYYSFARNDGYIIIFTTHEDTFGILTIGKYWEIPVSNAKKYFKMIGKAVDPNVFKNIFDEKTFFNEVERKYEIIYLYPTRQTIIREQIDREIQVLKNK